MRKALIIVQEEQLSGQQIQRLDAFVKRRYRKHVSHDKLLTIWNRIPAGQAFTRYEDSRASLVTMECENGFEQSRRVALMQALDKDWRSVTGQRPDAVMLAVVDEALFADVFKSSQMRLSLLGRVELTFRMLRSMFHARLSGTPIQFNPHL